MFSIRKVYNNLTSLYFNLFHNNNLYNLIDLCDKHGLDIVIKSIYNKLIIDKFNNKYDNITNNIFNLFNNIENLSNDEFKYNFYLLVKKNINENNIFNPVLFSIIQLMTTKYYIYGFIDNKQLEKFNLLKNNINNNLYILNDNDNNLLYNELSNDSKNKHILLFIKNMIIDYTLSIFDEYIEYFNNNKINELENNNNINKIVLDFTNYLNKFNLELENSINLYKNDQS